jgi:metal-responsive CopG/Arc/MetJ family transcriptional regulator
MMTATELALVDAWAAGERIRSRSEAIRRLIARGLAVEEQTPRDAGVKKRG